MEQTLQSGLPDVKASPFKELTPDTINQLQQLKNAVADIPLQTIISDQFPISLGKSNNGKITIDSVKGKTIQNYSPVKVGANGFFMVDVNNEYYHYFAKDGSDQMRLTIPNESVITVLYEQFEPNHLIGSLVFMDKNNNLIEDYFISSGEMVKITIPLNTDYILIRGLRNKTGPHTTKNNGYRFMILDSDWTNKNSPKYFEGIKSVGEDKSELIIESKNKNLYETPPATDSSYWLSQTNHAHLGNGWFKVFVDNSNNNFDNYAILYNKLLSIDKNKNYSLLLEIRNNKSKNVVLELSSYASYLVSQFSKVQEMVENKSSYQKIFTLTPRKSGNIRWGLRNYFYIQPYAILDLEYRITLVEGIQTEMTYTKPEKSSIHIPLSEPLRSLPNGISDEIKDGKLIRRIGKTVLNGSEIWLGSLQPNGYFYVYSSHIDSLYQFKDMNTINIMSEQFISTNIGYLTKELSNNEFIGHADTSNSSSQLRFSTKKVTTIEEWKAWLKTNNLTVYYELKTPIETEIISPLLLKSFVNGSLQIENQIIPTVNITYGTNLSSRLQATETEMLQVNQTIQHVWKTLIPIADKELGMKSITLLSTETTTDLKNKINQILNIWR